MDFAFLTPGELAKDGVRLTLLQTYPANEAKRHVPSYSFGIYRAMDGERVGTLSFRVGSRERLYLAGHIGYEVYREHRGNHYALKACRALFPFAKRHGYASVLITCNPDNLPSRRTCELTGGRLLAIAPVPETDEMYQHGDREKCVFEVLL